MERTKVVVAQPRSKSLRATIPAAIVRQFGIEEGWELGWELRARDNQLEILIVAIPPEEERERGKPRKRGGRA